MIPSLLVLDGGLVKTTRFRDPRYVGDPINAVRIFNEKEVDELLLLDISATAAGRAPDFDLVADVASECFMPLCYGGGIRSIEDAERLFGLGVEKICLQSAAMQDLTIVSRVAERYGRQAVVVSVDVEREGDRARLRWSAHRRADPRPWLDFVRHAAEAGAGEVMVNAVHKDGTQSGFDLALIQEASGAVTVPVVAAGGAGSLADIRAAIEAGASAVAVGAYFVFYGPHRAVLITYPAYAELESLLHATP